MGLVHSIEHSQRHSKTDTVQATHQADADHHDLFAGHDDETTCQLYDQLSMGGALVCNAIAQTHATPEAILLVIDGQDIYTHQRSLVQARAPPAILLAS